MIKFLITVTSKQGNAPKTPSSGPNTRAGATIGPQIVVFKNHVNVDETVSAFRDKYPHATVHHVYRHALKGMSVSYSADELVTMRSIEREPNVSYIEDVKKIEALAEQTDVDWGLDRISQVDLPLDNTYTYRQTGKGVNVYIFDTGINIYHEEFEGRAVEGFNTIDDGYGSLDCNGHGTHVSGIVGGSVYGVAKEVSFISVKVLDAEGVGDSSSFLAGLDWLMANARKPAVASFSLASPASSTMDNAVRSLIDNGISCVVAGGNSGNDASEYSPARVQEAITVGASSKDDALLSVTNTGPSIDIFAPGQDIRSSWHVRKSDTKVLSGTSMATPFVTGVVALILSGDPTAQPSAIKRAILEGASLDKLTDVPDDTANRLLYSLVDGTLPPEPEPEPEPIEPPCTDCIYYKGQLIGPGDSKFEPDGTYYTTANQGIHHGWLKGPDETDYDLYLLKWDQYYNRWDTVANSLDTASTEEVSYEGEAGSYIWLIYSYTGSGTYHFWRSFSLNL